MSVPLFIEEMEYKYPDLMAKTRVVFERSLKSKQQLHLSRDMTNQQNECAQSEDSDQPGHSPSLIRVFALCMKQRL